MPPRPTRAAAALATGVLLLVAVSVHGFVVPTTLPTPTPTTSSRRGFLQQPHTSSSSSFVTTPSTSTRSTRLYARVSQKKQENNDETEGEQGLPKALGVDGEEIPKLTRQQEEAIDLSMGVVPPPAEELQGEAWTLEVERRLQQMYEKGTYDPTPINMTPQELAKQQWLDEFLNKEERPIRWTPEYWFGTWKRGDIKYSSPGRGLKSFGFACVGIGITALIFLMEDELVNPLFEDYQKWDGNDFFHFGGDIAAWAASIPERASNYISHWNWVEWSSRVAARAGAAPRWQNQIMGLPADMLPPPSP